MYETHNTNMCRPLYSGNLLSVVILLLVVCTPVWTQQEWGGRFKRQISWSPWDDFHPVELVRLKEPDGAEVSGITVPWHIDDLLWEDDYPGNDPPISEYPPWYTRRINCFLGVPYAQPPVGQLRFRYPSAPRWEGVWDASYFRHACPQDLDELRKDIPDYPAKNISEDCLYMNIFVPNITKAEDNQLKPDTDTYPVIVYIHGGEFMHGSAQQFPGHVLATSMVVVVTFNYRLGSLGFLSTEDEYAQGNWGMFDQNQALKFVKDNIEAFRGDPTRITLMGDGAGAVSVGMHMVSPLSRGKNYYHQAVLMSGTDLSMFGLVEPYWRPREYAWQLAEYMGCPTHHSYDLIECLRENTTHTWQYFRDAQRKVPPKDGALGVVWAPVQDGTAVFSRPTSFIFLPETPGDLRRQNRFEQVPTMVGIDTDAGAMKANRTVKGLEGGMFDETFQEFVQELLIKWKIIDIYRDRATEAVDFQYTYWPDPANRTARAQEFINMVTDLEYGTSLDSVVKAQAQYQPNYVYEFKYKSWHDWVPKYMGTCCSAAVPYVFGFPFLNETVLNETGLIPRQWFDYDDRNMSEWMMYMWTNFAKYGEPTPNITRNITWEPYNPFNMTYVVLDWHSHIWFRYRQDFYGFWKDYFPSLVEQDYLYPTATPTPAGYEYVIATGAMTTLVILLICGIGILGVLLWQQKEDERVENAYRESDMPLGLVGHTLQSSQSSLSKRSLGAPEHLPPGSGPKPFDLGRMHYGGGKHDTSSISKGKHDKSYDSRRHESSSELRDYEMSRDYGETSFDRGREYHGPDRSREPKGYDRGREQRGPERSRPPGGYASRAFVSHPDNGSHVQGTTQHHTVV